MYKDLNGMYKDFIKIHPRYDKNWSKGVIE
jgi:hypothetical protein